MSTTFAYNGDPTQAVMIRDAIDAWLANPVGTITLTRPEAGIDLEFVIDPGSGVPRLDLVKVLRKILDCGLLEAKQLTDQTQFSLPAGAYLAYMDREGLTQRELIELVEAHGCRHVD